MPVNRNSWMRITTSGATWALVYNIIWALAWLVFMRTEWRKAMTAIGQPMPFTTQVWLVWAAMTLLIGVAIMVHAASQFQPSNAAIRGAVATWVLFTIGMAGWSVLDSLSVHVIALDSVVNLVAMVAASLVAVRILHGGRPA